MVLLHVLDPPAPTPKGFQPIPNVSAAEIEKKAAATWLSEVVASRTEARNEEQAEAIRMVCSLAASLPTLTQGQLNSARPRLSPHLSGIAGAASSRPKLDHAAQAAVRPRLDPAARPAALSYQHWREPAASPLGSPVQARDRREPTTLHWAPKALARASLTAPELDLSVLEALPSPAKSPKPSSSPTERPLHLVNLEGLQPKAASLLELRPRADDLGAACGPAGLGARGDEEMDAVEEERLRRQHELMHKAPLASRSAAALPTRGGSRATADSPLLRHVSTAPHNLAHNLASAGTDHSADHWGAQDSVLGANVPAKSSGDKQRAPRSSLLRSTSHEMLRLPTPHDLRRATSLGMLVPPEPPTDVQRALAYDKQRERPLSVQTSPAPVRFSSIASRQKSPLEFLASITDWSRATTPFTPMPGSAHGYAAGLTGTTRPQSRLMTPRGRRQEAAPQSRLVTPDWPPSPSTKPGTRLNTASRLSTANSVRSPSTRVGTRGGTAASSLSGRRPLPLPPPPPPPAREWVKLQAALKCIQPAEDTLSQIRMRNGRPLFRPPREPQINFIKARPVPETIPELNLLDVPWRKPLQTLDSRQERSLDFGL